MKHSLYLGAMTGTSLDGIDLALIEYDLDDAGVEAGLPRLKALESLPYPQQLREQVLAVAQGQPLTLPQLGQLDLAVARLYADAVRKVLAKHALSSSQIQALGAHGQTVFHQPLGDDRFTLQLGDPNTLAVRTGIAVVADFRRRDMALGGQGAPLAPIFHDLMFRSPKQARWVLNLGGIANLTGLVPGRATFGFDTGPANILMDAWTQRVQGQKYDRDGAWARGARLVPALLQDLLADPYFALAPPKSTGRELFNVDWLLARLKSHADLDPADVQRCLLELSVRSVSDAMAGAAVGVADGAGTQGELLVCGGGADNTFLMQRLAELNPRLRVARTEDMGVPGEAVEAMAFAVFAQKTLRGIEVDTPSITGASRACLLGTVYRP